MKKKYKEYDDITLKKIQSVEMEILKDLWIFATETDWIILELPELE